MTKTEAFLHLSGRPDRRALLEALAQQIARPGSPGFLRRLDHLMDAMREDALRRGG
jgi:hypothetical protein